jgi:hypothetical protein
MPSKRGMTDNPHNRTGIARLSDLKVGVEKGRIPPPENNQVFTKVFQRRGIYIMLSFES